jgi:antitoxin component YwqK of YwqJK toxin-antitoxin module
LYWFNGKLAEKGSYVNNDADGIWEEYNENGQLETKKLYKNGEYVKQLPITKNI